MRLADLGRSQHHTGSGLAKPTPEAFEGVEARQDGLRAVFVGINPSLTSVAVGHYYQGAQGLRLWKRLEDAGIVTDLPRGRQDEAAHAQGPGFADLVREPTARAQDVAKAEIQTEAPDLATRLASAAGALIVFVYAKAHEVASQYLMQRGWHLTRMPGPYASREDVSAAMSALAEALLPDKPSLAPRREFATISEICAMMQKCNIERRKPNVGKTSLVSRVAT
jgi:hypothetical protein